jgi:5-methyltetrahydrofolate--homocysteine methyltransferase
VNTVLRSGSRIVTISADGPFVIIGERINPTGRPVFTQELRDGNLARVGVDAAVQVGGGADMLDVNAGIPLVDEAELLKAMIIAAQAAVDVPLCIDSSVVDALEAALSVYDGRALVNSVTAEDDRLEEILPLVARHGAAVIGLAHDEKGIPETAEERLAHARKIVAAAAQAGVASEDVVIDPLAMPVGADADAAKVTLEAIRLIRDDLGVNTCIGASNVGFGLPERRILDAAFLPMAMAAGLTSAIMTTVAACVESVRAADLLLGHDPWAAGWIASYHARRRHEEAAASEEASGSARGVSAADGEPSATRSRAGRAP